MKEIKQIIERMQAFSPGEKAVLATVVDVQGSGYRLPGARMLILENGETCGMVSGGCLEADVLERAKRVLRTGTSEVFVYDTTADEESVFSLNMGCRGIIRILIEPVQNGSAIIGALRSSNERTSREAIATLISGGREVETGGRMFCDEAGNIRVHGIFPRSSDESGILEKFSNFVSSAEQFGLGEFVDGQNRVELAFEKLDLPVSLLIFGAGADAVPVAQIASELGWQVSVFDHRAAFLTPERFPSARELFLRNLDGNYPDIKTDDKTAAVVMTHNYERDKEILPVLLERELFYLAALGPKRRTETLLNEIKANGRSFDEQQLSRLFGPAGLDIGGDTPEAIALSIVAEIQAVLKSRQGGHLRDRQGSIYGR